MPYNEDYVNWFYKMKDKNGVPFNSILTDSSYHYDITNLSDRKRQRSLEHYLIKKKVSGGKLTPREEQLVNQIFSNFRNHPELFYNSPVIRDKAIDLFAPSPEIAQKIKNFRNNFYDMNEIQRYHDKLLKEGLTDKEKDRYFSMLNVYLHKDLNPYKSKYYQIYKDTYTYLLNHYEFIKDMRESEFAFAGQYITNLTNSEQSYFVDFNAFSDVPNLGGDQLNMHIFINKETSFTKTLADFTQVICHENRHAHQEYYSHRNQNREAFEMATTLIFMRNLNGNGYDSYHDNYLFQDVEIDAEHEGFFKGAMYLNMHGRLDLADQIRKTRVERLDKRKYYEYMKNKDGQIISPDKYIVENLNEIIKNHPEYISEYPCFGKLFNKDGSRKSFDRILYEKANEDVSNRGLTDYYINYGINNGELNNIDLGGANKEYRKKHYRNISSIYRDHALIFLDYCNDDRKNISSGQIVTTTLYQLSIMSKVLSYAISNIEEIVSLRESKMNNREDVFKYLYDLRDFDISKIPNEIIKTNPKILEKYSEVKDKVNYILKVVNQLFVEDRLNALPKEIQNSNITLPNGKVVNFTEFFMSGISRMDSHQEVQLNGRKHYMGDIISYYKGIAENNLTTNLDTEAPGIKVS